MVSEEKKEEIKKEARAILEKFGRALEKVPAVKQRDEDKGSGMRDEHVGESCDEDFRKRMLENAPKKDKDCIIAEKASWT